MSAPRIAAIVLAAGLSRRMGGANKLLQPVRGAPLAAHALRAARASKADPVILVTGRDGDAVAALADARVRRAHNAAPEAGLASSLQCGIAAAGAVDGALILLADMPEIDAALLDALIARWSGAHYAVAPEKGGVLGNPVLLGAEALADCARLSGDRGARALLEANAARVLRVPVETDAIFRDIDRPEDL